MYAMGRLVLAEEFFRFARAARHVRDLEDALAASSTEMGFQYFALTHHVDFASFPASAVRMHNYPSSWVSYFDENGLGQSDPIHRASHVTSVGFAWSAVPQMIRMTRRDRDILARAGRIGIVDGFTVPGHVPGEVNGSCSFAVAPGRHLPGDHLSVAQLIGTFAFEGARRLTGLRRIDTSGKPILTDRQRDCVLWAARGKTDWEIAQILGVSHETVIRHLKQARERYGVQKRAVLAVRALFDGLISFADVLRR